MDQEQERIRGEKARQILNDELVVEAFSLIEKQIIEQWEQAPARDKEGKEHLWIYYKVLKKFKAHLEDVLNTGKMAAIQLQEKKKFKYF